ncbi:MAG: geranylgeranylglycerol-phosphate geranylgeranyltransferase [Saprospiraceae bacterium]|nr:geranylgeranylglycerol-phosphate geranylgeranyltransferase [Saprospiraceae bacterium]
MGSQISGRIARIQIIRPLNLLIIVATQAIIFAFVIYNNIAQPALNYLLAGLLSLTTVLLAASGYIVNDIFDQKADLINRPQKTWVGISLSKQAAWLYYVNLVSSGLILSVYIAIKTSNIHLLPLYPGAVLLMFWYAYGAKKMGFIGNILVSFMTSFVTLIIIIAERSSFAEGSYQSILHLLLAFSLFSFLINLVREIVKDIQDIEGDQILKSGSFPIRYGVPMSKHLCAVLALVLVFMDITFQFTFPHSFHLHCFSTLFIIGPIFKFLAQLYKSRTTTDYHKDSMLLKFIMMLGLLYLILISLPL